MDFLKGLGQVANALTFGGADQLINGISGGQNSPVGQALQQIGGSGVGGSQNANGAHGAVPVNGNMEGNLIGNFFKNFDWAKVGEGAKGGAMDVLNTFFFPNKDKAKANDGYAPVPPPGESPPKIDMKDLPIGIPTKEAKETKAGGTPKKEMPKADAEQKPHNGLKPPPTEKKETGSTQSAATGNTFQSIMDSCDKAADSIEGQMAQLAKDLDDPNCKNINQKKHDLDQLQRRYSATVQMRQSMFELLNNLQKMFHDMQMSCIHNLR